MSDDRFIEDARNNAEDVIACPEGCSQKAHSAFLAYLGLPPGARSLSAAYRVYRGETGAGQGEQDNKSAPAYFESWSSKWSFVSRSERYDFHMGEIARARQSEQHILDIQECVSRVKKTSLSREAFFARVSGYCHRRLTEYERQDVKAAEQAAQFQLLELDSQLAGREFKRPKERAILPTPIKKTRQGTGPFRGLGNAFLSAEGVFPPAISFQFALNS